jgi:hypothetical protein
MEANEANAALNQTVAQLQGGVLRLGIGGPGHSGLGAGARWLGRARGSGPSG